MWDKLGFVAAIVGTFIGGTALCLVVASVMYFGIYAFAGAVGKGQAAHWDDVFPISLTVDSDVRNSPRVVIRGDKVDGGCRHFFGMESSPGVSSTRTRTVWQDHDTCETVMEVRAIPSKH